ncbi:MAG: RNA polymerase sigma factor [Phycisphaerales bacterium]|nr:RNA polymerase sigma factor [Phycisphaerales bacterium]
MDRAEFERQALEHFEAVYRMAYHLTGTAERAEDLTQEVFVRALRPKSVEAFNPHGGGLKSFLLVICHNAYFSHIKKAVRESGRLAPGEEAVDEHAGPSEPGFVFDRATMNWEHVDDRLKRAVEQLGPEFREVLLLWSVEGLKYREIAEILGVRIGTVMSRLFRARQSLLQTLAGDAQARDQWRLGKTTVSDAPELTARPEPDVQAR